MPLFSQVKQSKEGAPKHPGHAFVFFGRKMRPKLRKKYPGLSVKEMNAKLTERYAALSAEKKKIYIDQAAEAMGRYRAEMKKFESEHPDLVMDNADPPKKPPTAVKLYMQKHAQLSRSEALVAFKALSNEEREQYLAEEKRLREAFVDEVEAYREQYPGWQMPVATRRSVNKAKETKNKTAKRMPGNAYNVFIREVYHSVDPTLSNAERLAICTEMWRSADAATKARCQRIAEQEKAEYLEYIKTLPEEKQAQLRAKLTAPNPTERRETRLRLKKIRQSVKKITARELFLKEKMPTDSDMLSEEEWQKILSKKFARLSSDDKVSGGSLARFTT